MFSEANSAADWVTSFVAQHSGEFLTLKEEGPSSSTNLLLLKTSTFDTSYLSEIELGCQLLFYTVELDGITCFATLLFLPLIGCT